MGAKKISDDELQHYSLQQIAEMSGLSYRTIKRKAADGSLKSKRVGGRRLVSRKAYLDFMEIGPSETVPTKRND